MSEGRTVTGACRFCGQTKMITLTEDEWLERIRKENKEGDEIADDIATEECTCKTGSDWRADHYVIAQNRENIEMMFRENHGVIADIFQAAAQDVYYQEIKRISIQTPENGVATMARAGGNLEIKFTEKHETKLTASY